MQILEEAYQFIIEMQEQLNDVAETWVSHLIEDIVQTTNNKIKKVYIKINKPETLRVKG